MGTILQQLNTMVQSAVLGNLVSKPGQVLVKDAGEFWLPHPEVVGELVEGHFSPDFYFGDPPSTVTNPIGMVGDGLVDPVANPFR